MELTKAKFKEIREENKKLKEAVIEIVKVVKNEPYAHNQKVFDISASVNIHENLIS